ncbi:Glucose-responsive transcription factor [Rhizina undulata]
MAMAEVVANPSQTSAAGTTVPAVAGSSSRSRSPLLFPSSSPSSSTQHTITQSQQQSRIHEQNHHSAHSIYNPTASPGDGSSTNFFSHHQRLSPPGSMHMSSERNIPRGLPPIVSSMSRVSPSGSSVNDPRQPISPRTIPMSLNDPSQALDGMPGDPTAPRKRSKVSRACDECRRKKIRCDATSESGVEQCSSCKRVGSKCSFSRVPMKRGPSKGYIKELADRLNTLENSISTGDLHSYGSGIPGEGDQSPGPSDSTSPPPAGPPSAQKSSRKRALSSSSDFQAPMHLQPLAQPNPNARGNERLPSIDSFHPANQLQHQQRAQHLQHEPQPQRQLLHPQQLSGTHAHPPPPQHSPHPVSSSSAEVPQPGYKPNQSPNGMGPYWRNYSDVGGRRASVSFPFESPEAQRPATNPLAGDNGLIEWDEEAIDQYYDLIHPTFPLLSNSKDRLRQRLSNSSITIREALLEALYSTVRSNPSSTLRPNAPPANTKRACELTVAAQFDNPAVRTMPTNLLYLQIMIFMALEADNHGPATMRGQLGLPRAAWLGAAVGLAYNLKLHHNRVRERHSSGDPDSDEKLGRRAWWILVILDRWHAISTSSPLFIPDSSVVLLPEDQLLLGLAPFHIARLSCILGHLAEAFATSDEAATAASFNPLLSKVLRGELERFRESVDGVWGSLNLLHVAYHHVKLLTLRHNSSTEPYQLLEPAQRIAAMLDSSQTRITPLNHHFAALALLTLVDLTEIPETREEAWKGIQQLTEALEKRRGVATREDSTGWDRAIKDLINRRKSIRFGSVSTSTAEIPPGHGSLQHLADLAVGEHSPTTPGSSYGGGVLGGTGLETGRLQRFGYLGSILL